MEVQCQPVFCCPFCRTKVSRVDSFAVSMNFQNRHVFLEDMLPKSATRSSGNGPNASFAQKLGPQANCLLITQWKCPECHRISVFAEGVGEDYREIECMVYPFSAAKIFPDYVPKAVASSYKEAYDVLDRSPGASAAYARRALQAILRGYFQVKPGPLAREIDEALRTGNIDANQAKVFHALRDLGNCGAHPGKDIMLITDVERNEAEAMVRYIEYLIESTYVKSAELEALSRELEQASRHQPCGPSPSNEGVS